MKVLVAPLVVILLLGSASCGKKEPLEATTEGGAGRASVPGTTILQPGTTFTADRNPLKGDSNKTAVMSLSWTTKAQKTEVHVDSPDGKLLASTGSSGHVTTGDWVTNGMTFYLQDATAGHPGDKTATLATLTAAVQ